MNSVRSMAVALLLATPITIFAADAAEAPPKTQAPDGKTISLLELIEQVSRRTGTQFVVDPRVRADVPLVGMDPARVDLDRLRAILRVHMFVAAQEKGFVSIVPDANARQLPSRIFYAPGIDAPDDEVVTVVLQARNLCAPQSVPVLRPLQPQAAHLASLPPDMIIINDRAQNARRIAEIFTRMDAAAAPGKPCADKGQEERKK
jgi:general secretion pathway protein D